MGWRGVRWTKCPWDSLCCQFALEWTSEPAREGMMDTFPTLAMSHPLPCAQGQPVGWRPCPCWQATLVRFPRFPRETCSFKLRPLASQYLSSRIERCAFQVEHREYFLTVVENFTGGMLPNFVITFLMSKGPLARPLFANKPMWNCMPGSQWIEWLPNDHSVNYINVLLHLYNLLQYYELFIILHNLKSQGSWFS